MTQVISKDIIAPELYDSLITLKNDIFYSLNAVKIGMIKAFNPSTKTAVVQILFKRVLPDESIMSYPVLVDVPVFTLQGAGSGLQMPIAAGDACIILFSDRNIDAWFQNGSEAAPNDARVHDISDGIALVGINALTSTLAAYQPGLVRLFHVGGAEVDLSGSLVAIKNQTTSLLLILSGLIDVLTTLQVNGPLPLTAPSIAALQAYKLQLATLLL